MSINYTDTNVTDCSHHSFHGHCGDSCIRGRPAEISTPSCCLSQAPESKSHHMHQKETSLVKWQKHFFFNFLNFFYGKWWIRIIGTNTVSYKRCHMFNTSALWQVKKTKNTGTQFACILKRNNYLYCVLISSNLGLPWKCENTGTKNYRVIDFNILFIVDWINECMDPSSLKQNKKPEEMIKLSLLKWNKGAEG